MAITYTITIKYNSLEEPMHEIPMQECYRLKTYIEFRKALDRLHEIEMRDLFDGGESNIESYTWNISDAKYSCDDMFTSLSLVDGINI